MVDFMNTNLEFIELHVTQSAILVIVTYNKYPLQTLSHIEASEIVSLDQREQLGEVLPSGHSRRRQAPAK